MTIRAVLHARLPFPPSPIRTTPSREKTPAGPAMEPAGEGVSFVATRTINPRTCSSGGNAPRSHGFGLASLGLSNLVRHSAAFSAWPKSS
jgi:hypothetical protein